MGTAAEHDRDVQARPARVMTLRRDGTCRDCGATLLAGSRAEWDPVAKTTTCAACLGHPTDRVTIVWASGSARPAPAYPERKLGDALDALRAGNVVVLHDRRIPRTSANIDHLVVAPSGVHVIDAKRYKGRIDIRASGSIFRPGPSQLFVGNRNQHQLVVSAQRQAEVVKTAIADVCDPDALDAIVRPTLCFVDGDWAWFAKPEVLDGVGITGPKGLAGWLTEPGPLTPDQIAAIGARLSQSLRPA